MTEELELGALLDDRTEEERLKDYHFDEMVSAPEPVNWKEKPREQWRRFPIFDQNGSGSCVAQTVAKMLGINYFLKDKSYVHFSATHVYQRRVNKPSGGMRGVDALDIARKGVTLEVLAPSQRLTDSQMDAFKVEPYVARVGEVFKTSNYVLLPIRDIDTVASVIQKTGKGVMVWFFFKSTEWKKEVPTIIHPDLPQSGSATARHSVTAVDFTLYQGKKALIIEDSWGVDTGYKGQRVITEDFFNRRNFFAAYALDFNFDTNNATKPQAFFANDLHLSSAVNDEVRVLQDCLKYEGVFPTNIESTGVYGAITAKAVLEFQRKHKVASEADLVALGGRTVGPKTREVLNKLFST